MEVIIGILLTIGAIYISVLFINFAIDAIISILETIAGPVLGIIGVLLLIGSIELFKGEDYKHGLIILPIGAVLLGICMFNLGKALVDSVILFISAIIFLVIVIFVFYGIFQAISDDVFIAIRIAVSAAISSIVAVILIAIAPLLSYVPFLNTEESILSRSIKTVDSMETKIASRFSQTLFKDDAKLVTEVEETAAEADVTEDIAGKETAVAEESLAEEGILSSEIKNKIAKETGWSSNIIDSMRSEKEYLVYKNASLSERTIADKQCLVTKIDWNYKDAFGRTNMERAKSGLAPLDKNGDPIELHHIGQKTDSPLAELTMEEHRGKGNDSILHDKSVESEIDRSEFATERSTHWRARAAEEASSL